METLSKIIFIAVCAFCFAAPASGFANSRPEQFLKSFSSAKPERPGNTDKKVPGRMPLGKIRILDKDGKMVDVYASMEWQFTRFYEDQDVYREYWDYYIRFYSDAANTSPYALTSSITFNYQWAYSSSDPNDHGHWTQTATGSVGTTEVYLEEVEIYYADAFYWREVVLSMLPGAGYKL
jgi:hypothetical protein